MATTRIREEAPTASAVALDLRDGGRLPGVTREDVIAAAVARRVPVREGRIAKRDVSNVYFQIARERGVIS